MFLYGPRPSRRHLTSIQDSESRFSDSLAEPKGRLSTPASVVSIRKSTANQRLARTCGRVGVMARRLLFNNAKGAIGVVLASHHSFKIFSARFRMTRVTALRRMVQSPLDPPA